MTGSRNSALFAAAALVLAVAFALGLAEAALEAVDYPPSSFSPWIRMDDTGYGYAPSLQTRMRRPGEYDVAFETNAAGFRDDEFGPKKEARIVLLGDSFASGYGVERSRVFADLLEARLGVEILNTAVGGYEIIHQVRFFRSRGRTLQPDLVVYALYLGNDLSRNDEWRVTDTGALESPDRTFPLRTSHPIKLQILYRQVRYSVKLRGEQERGEWVPWPDYLVSAERRLSPEGERDYREVEDLLRQLREETHGAGARLVVVMIPYRQMVEKAAYERLRAATPGFDERYDLGLPASRTSEILDRLGIEHFDLSPSLRAHFDGGGEPLFFPVDGHLNVEGNAFVAQSLEPVLRRQLDDVRAVSVRDPSS